MSNVVNLEGLIEYAKSNEASDLLIDSDGNAKMRVSNNLVNCTVKLDESEYARLEGPVPDLNKTRDHEYRCLIGGIYYRVNFFSHFGGWSYTIRIPYTKELSFENLGISSAVPKLLSNRSGIIFVSGYANTGKSTTANAMIEYLNRNRNCHIMTIETTIEHDISPKKAFISQREFKTDEHKGIASRATHENVDVIYFSEVDNRQSVIEAIRCAESGMLVICVTHTHGVQATLEYIEKMFDADQKDWIRHKLSRYIRGMVAQSLIPGSNKVSRVLAAEVLINNPSIAMSIMNDNYSQDNISDTLDSFNKEGMHSLDSDIARLARSGVIDKTTASEYAVSRKNILKLL